jgi:rubrerythrin
LSTTSRITARDIVRIALDVEQTGMQCYQAMKASTEDGELRKLLDYLAREEQGHVEVFTEMFRSVELDPATMPDPSPEDEAYLQVILKSVVFEGPEAGMRLAREARQPVDMLRFALRFERDAMLFWLKLFKLVRADDRPLIQKLIEQEEQHVREIDHLLTQRQTPRRSPLAR